MIGISLSMISAVNAPIEVLNVAVGLAILKEKEEGTWMRRSSARKPAATATEAPDGRRANEILRQPHFMKKIII